MIITTIIATCSAGGRSPAQPLLECKGRVAPAAVPELRREETVLSDSCLFLWNRSTSVASQKLRFVFNLQRLYTKKTNCENKVTCETFTTNFKAMQILYKAPGPPVLNCVLNTVMIIVLPVTVALQMAAVRKVAPPPSRCQVVA